MSCYERMLPGVIMLIMNLHCQPFYHLSISNHRIMKNIYVKQTKDLGFALFSFVFLFLRKHFSAVVKASSVYQARCSRLRSAFLGSLTSSASWLHCLTNANSRRKRQRLKSPGFPIPTRIFPHFLGSLLWSGSPAGYRQH